MVENVVGLRYVEEGKDELIRGARQAENAIDSLAATTVSAAKRINTTTSTIARQNDVLAQTPNIYHRSTNSMNAMGTGVQQVGYQVGDFLVQVQSGTNAFVAFGQQATQLVGILPLFSGALGVSAATLVGWSAGLGIAIPLTTAIAAAFMRTKDAADKTGDALKSLRSAVSDYTSAAESLRMSQSELNTEFGRFASFASTAFEAMRQSALQQINQDVQNIANTFTDVADLAGEQIPSALNASLRDFLGLSTGIRETSRLVAEFVNAQIDLANAQGFEAQAAAAADLLATFDRLTAGSEVLTEEQKAYRDALAGLVLQLSEAGAADLTGRRDINAALAEGVQLFYDMRDAQAEQNAEREAAVQAINTALLDETRSLLARQAIAQTILDYGEDSVQLYELQAGLAREAYMAEQMAEGVKGKNLKTLMAEYDATVAVEASVRAAAASMQNMASMTAIATAEARALAAALASAAGYSAGLQNQIIGLRAQIAAAREGADQYAQAAAAELAQRSAELNAALGSEDAAIRAVARQELDQINALLGERVELQREIQTINEAASTTGGGGATEEELANLQKFVDAMQTRISQERELIGLYGQARREREIYFELIKQLEDAEVSYNAQAVADAASRLAAEEDINKRIGEQQDAMQSLADDLGGVFADFFESGFSDFESFTDGILGIFQKMLADMIAEAASAQVMKFLMGSAGGATSTGALAGGVASAGKVAAGGGGAMNIVSSVAGTAGAMTGLGGAIAGLAGPAAIAIGLFSIFRARQQRRNAEEKKESDERYKLETRLLELQGKTGELREREIEALHPGNRALGRRIQRLEDEQRITAEREALELQMLQLQGDVAELRRRELAALDESNRALQKEIWALQDAAAIALERAGLEQQLLQLQGDTAALRQMELDALDESNRALQEQIWALEDQAAAAEEAARVADEQANLEQQLLQLQGDTAALRALELDALDESNRALQEQIWALEDAAAIADERAGLEQQLLQLQGDTAALRALELEALDESNRALQEQIWALEDQAAAAEEAARVADERTSLERQLLELQGDTAVLRAMDLEQLDASNQALQLQIWALEDQAAAAEEAARIADERAGLERQLLELQGDTNALRQLDLAALDASNRALQMQIWALEDMKRVLDDIDMNDFVSLVDYNRAVARANAEVMAGTANLNTAPVSVSTIPTPPVTTSTPTTTAGGSTGAIGGMTDVEVRDAVRYLTDITQQLLTKIDNNTRRSSNVLTTWDEDGIPPERAA